MVWRWSVSLLTASGTTGRVGSYDGTFAGVDGLVLKPGDMAVVDVFLWSLTPKRSR